MKNVLSKNKPMFIGLGVLIAVLIAAIILFSGKSDDSIPGTYSLVDASGTGSEMFKATVGDATLTINTDNTGTLSMFDQETPVVIDTHDKKISFDGGKSYSPYTFENKKLTVDNGGYKAVFKKK
ncbi:MAG: hypothetical protein IJ639_03990 [Ruminococcus sp.]|nr:hypothetical protein [Ruminococcus sp.]